MNDTTLRVSYLELVQAPAAPSPTRHGAESIAAEKLPVEEYLDLYVRVGEPLGWDQRLKMPRPELIQLLESPCSQV